MLGAFTTLRTYRTGSEAGGKRDDHVTSSLLPPPWRSCHTPEVAILRLGTDGPALGPTGTASRGGPGSGLMSPPWD